MKKKKNKVSFCECVENISQISSKMLFICLPLILAAAVSLLFAVADGVQISPAYTAIKYGESLEYIMMSLALTVCGAAIVDIAEKRGSI